jgi:hypothetical protein
MTMNMPSAEAQSLLDMIGGGGGSDDITPSQMVARLRSIPPMAAKDPNPPLLSVADFPFESAGRALKMRLYRPEQGLLQVGRWNLSGSLPPHFRLVSSATFSVCHARTSRPLQHSSMK